ncbi:hypothetical protein NE664_05490 [Anaerotignum faecicola]|nr:hypothetical protein [Anaerotignum faecicola]
MNSKNFSIEMVVESSVKQVRQKCAGAANMAANGFNTSIAPRHVKTIRGPYKSKSGI